MTGGLDNWSVSNPGMITSIRIIMVDLIIQKRIRRTVAHEFGHILGIGDAYGGAQGLMQNYNRNP